MMYSSFSKIMHFEAFDSWIKEIESRRIRLFLKYTSIPMEVASVLVLLYMSFDRRSIPFVAGASGAALILSALSTRFHSGDSCACFGEIGSKKRTAKIFAIYTCISLISLLAWHFFDGRWAVPREFGEMAWISGSMTCVVLLQSNAIGLLDKGQKIPPIAAPDTIDASLTSLIPGYARNLAENRPVVILMTIDQCPLCHEATQFFERLTSAFPEVAEFVRYHSVSSSSSRLSEVRMCSEQSRHIYDTGEFRRAIGVSKFPSLVILKEDGSGTELLKYSGTSAIIRTLLDLLSQKSIYR